MLPEFHHFLARIRSSRMITLETSATLHPAANCWRSERICGQSAVGPSDHIVPGRRCSRKREPLPEESLRAEVRLDDVQFALSALQPRPTVGAGSAVAVHSTLCRLHAVSCAIEVGYGVLARLRPRPLLARPFRRPLLHLVEDGPGRHCARPASTRLPIIVPSCFSKCAYNPV